MLKRKDIIDRFAEKGYTKKASAVIIDDFVRMIAEVLVEGEEISFHGFGTFKVMTTKDREMQNYATKEMISVPSHRAPKFVAGAQLKRWVREGFIREGDD